MKKGPITGGPFLHTQSRNLLYCKIPALCRDNKCRIYNLYAILYFHPRPIPKYHSHAAIHAHRHIIHHVAPEPLVKLCHRLGLLLSRHILVDSTN